jgi:amino acid transporter
VINITVGGGVFRLPANAAAELGAAAPLGYLICAVAMGLIVRCIADAGSRVPLTGGPYAFIGVALGPYAGFLSAILLLMIGLFGGAALGSVFAASVGGLVPVFASRAGEASVLVAALLWWSVINMRGVALGTRLNSAAVIVKVIPLLVVGIGGLYFVRGANFHVTSWPAASAVARASLLLAFIFGGVEVALVPSCVVAAWQLRAGGGETLSARMRLGGLVPWLAGLTIAALLTGTRREEWLGISICLLLATVLYAGVCARQRTGSRAPDAP